MMVRIVLGCSVSGMFSDWNVQYWKVLFGMLCLGKFSDELLCGYRGADLAEEWPRFHVRLAGISTGLSQFDLSPARPYDRPGWSAPLKS
jgi:hypothetical protein